MQLVEEGHASSFSVNCLGILLVKSSKVEIGTVKEMFF